MCVRMYCMRGIVYHRSLIHSRLHEDRLFLSSKLVDLTCIGDDYIDEGNFLLAVYFLDGLE